MFLVDVFRELNKRHVKYLVAGGVAATLHGNPRFTKDLDILVDLGEANLSKVVRAFKALGFIPRVPVKPEDLISEENRERWIGEKGMLVFTFLNPQRIYETVDIMITAPILYNQAFKRREVFDSQGVRVPVVSVKDLIFMKEKAGRPQDLQDVAILKTTQSKLAQRKGKK